MFEGLADNTTLVAVSKTFPAEAIRSRYNQGYRDFGENRVPEFLEKFEALHDLSIRWHFVGGIQRNKVRKLIGKVALIHSLDSAKLFEKIHHEASRAKTSVECLIQVNISQEHQKGGIIIEELEPLIGQIRATKSEFCRIMGLMCIGSSISRTSEEQVRAEFRHMRQLFDQLANKQDRYIEMKYLSMGMSGDYVVAQEEGSNMIRLGTSIFGRREV